MESFSIKTKLTFEDFRKLNFFLLYRKGITRFALIFGSMMLLIIFVPYITSIPFWEEFPTIPFGIAFAMTFHRSLAGSAVRRDPPQHATAALQTGSVGYDRRSVEETW